MKIIIKIKTNIKAEREREIDKVCMETRFGCYLCMHFDTLVTRPHMCVQYITHTHTHSFIVISESQ